uniref:CYCLIN domain-containing protein n=1 Tax=Macrostomum lignano TaxID=282301 RepID=A0A1I8H4H7_9PLAT
MVHNMSDSRRKRRKSSKKFSYRGSYSASSEELANINNSNISNKVQIREQTEVHSVTQLQQVSPPPPPPRSLLPDGLEEGIYRLLDAEMVYHPRTDCLLNNTVCGDDKVNPGLRDEAMFSLRFLHKLHNLAPECFAHAVNITDRFLARVKVKAKYMSCLATAAYLIAARMIEEPENQPSPEKLVRIARCGGSPTDLERMAAIIRVKLRPTAACDPAGIEKPQQLQQEAGRLENAVTPLHFLSLLAPLFNSREQFLRAVGDLETALCSVTVYSCRPALLALCVARRHLLAADAVGAAHSSSMLAVLDAAAQLMQLSQADLASCDALIARETQRVQGLLDNYQLFTA